MNLGTPYLQVPRLAARAVHLHLHLHRSTAQVQVSRPLLPPISEPSVLRLDPYPIHSTCHLGFPPTRSDGRMHRLQPAELLDDGS